jgi:ribosomal protein S30
MYGSHGNMIEKFAGKSRDTSSKMENKQSKQLRDKRRYRRNEE